MADQHDQHEPEEEFDSWDAFWDEQLRREAAERGEAPTTTIRGVEVRVPADMPLGFEERLRRAQAASDEDTFRDLLSQLFGVDVLDAWVAAGMGRREYEVVLIWGVSRGRGSKITFQEAYERYKAREALGKALEGEAETISTQTSGESAATGDSSRATSTVSTGSTRKPSRRSRGASSGRDSTASPPTASTG